MTGQRDRKRKAASSWGDVSPLPGRATAEGTQRYADRFSGGFASDFYRTAAGLTVSSIGMGTYLGECDDEEDARYVEVITAGAASGLNLIDTAINYRCQRSERAVGTAIQRIVREGIAARDEIVVSSKGGYVPLDGNPPASRADYSEYLDREYFQPGIIARDELVAAGHCLSPSFIANQVERSLGNLGVECIDIFYVHNPEQQLETVGRDRFHLAMGEVFRELESQVSKGRIGAYGCATWNGLRQFPASRTHLSLGELLELAEQAGGKGHHFRVVQLPVNLALTEAVRAPTQSRNGKNLSVLDAAAESGVSVVASASLMQAQLASRLPGAVKAMFPQFSTDAQCAIAFVRSLPIAAALVGMRTRSHLDENLQVGRKPAAR